METFLFEHMSLMSEHLGTGEADAQVLKTWRQMHLPRRGSPGRLDLGFVATEREQPVLCLAELKNEPIGKGAVDQVTGYLEAWRRDAKRRNRDLVAKWLESTRSPSSWRPRPRSRSTSRACSSARANRPRASRRPSGGQGSMPRCPFTRSSCSSSAPPTARGTSCSSIAAELDARLK